MNSITHKPIWKTAWLVGCLALAWLLAWTLGAEHELRREQGLVGAREGQFLAAWKACAPAVYVEGSDPVQAALQDRVPGLHVCAFLETGEYGLFEWHIENYGKPGAKMVHTWAPIGRWRP